MNQSSIKLLILTSVLVFQSCIWPNTSDDFIDEQQYQAVTMLRSEFENSTELLPPKAIEETGKIYVKDNLLFINEPNAGFHIFDNSNPSAPVNINFLKVLGMFCI